MESLRGTPEKRTAENEPSMEMDPHLRLVRADLQQNYTEHLKSIETTSLEILQSVADSARSGFRMSLTLNALSFLLGSAVILLGMIMLWQSPENFIKIAGLISSLVGSLLVVVLLFWKGPLDRILDSVSNLARINSITLGLMHRLNQVSRVFVQESLAGKVNVESLGMLNNLVQNSVHDAMTELGTFPNKNSAEEQAKKVIQALAGSNEPN